MERVDTTVVGTGGDEHGRQVDPRANVMVRRVGEEPAELFGVVRGAILGDPVAGDEEAVVAEHVQQRHLADDGPVEVRPLRSDRAHEQAAVAASLSCNAGGVGVLLADEPLGAAVKVVEGVLLLVQHTAAVPALAVLVAAADTGLHHDHSAFQQ